MYYLIDVYGADVAGFCVCRLWLKCMEWFFIKGVLLTVLWVIEGYGRAVIRCAL